MSTPPPSPSTSAALPSPSPGAPAPGKPSRPFGHLVMGVLLPLFTVGFEAITHQCAEMLFDPIPTSLHVALIVLVAVSNGWTWWLIRRPSLPSLPWAGLLNGIALVVSAGYAVVFVPVLPIALIGVLAAGIGILPMAPMFAVIASIQSRFAIRRMAEPAGVEVPLWRGFAVGVILVVAMEAPVGLTRVAMANAAHGTAESQARAVRVLRWMGHEETLRGACYNSKGKASIVGLFLGRRAHLTTEQARAIYYRVHGVPFTMKGRPELRDSWDDRWDGDLAAEVVGGIAPGVHLAASTLHGSVDGEAALAYLEWTFQFENQEPRQQEARMHIQLPPGAVVSRATLFVDGEEREAAYAGTGAVVAAYKAVVERRRDPLLVTWRSPDRVQVQCFPVVQGTPMKIKLGISVPMTVSMDGARATLSMPTIADHNFVVDEPVVKQVVLESGLPVVHPTLKEVHRNGEVPAVVGVLTSKDLASHRAIVHRPPTATDAWTADMEAPEFIITQRVEHTRGTPPDRWILVVDGSASMKQAREAVMESVAAIAPPSEVALIAADDVEQVLLAPSRASAETSARLSTAIASMDFVGGRDNLRALRLASTVVVPGGRTDVVWIHGAQPALLSAADEVIAAYQGLPGVRLIDIAISRGPNRISDALAGSIRIQPWPRSDALAADLTRLFTRSSAEHVAVQRQRVRRESVVGELAGKETSSHLARLFTYEEILDLAPRAQGSERDALIARAVKHRLITPLTGAVVLERQEQFDAAGLKPVDSSTVPSLPEPGLAVLLAVAFMAILMARRAGTA